MQDKTAAAWLMSEGRTSGVGVQSSTLALETPAHAAGVC